MIYTILIISFILVLWFKTDVWLEYCRFFKLNRLSFYKDFDDKYYNDVSLTYHLYLRRDHNCFFVRLITCPICLSVWMALLSIIANIIFLFVLGLGIIPLIILFFLLLPNIPLIVLGSLVVFGIIDKLL